MKIKDSLVQSKHVIIIEKKDFCERKGIHKET